MAPGCSARVTAVKCSLPCIASCPVAWDSQIRKLAIFQLDDFKGELQTGTTSQAVNGCVTRCLDVVP